MRVVKQETASVAFFFGCRLKSQPALLPLEVTVVCALHCAQKASLYRQRCV